jgi:hypothetical protein
MKSTALLTAIMAGAIIGPVNAAPLFKCTDAAAKVSWQDKPCDGTSKPVDVQPANRSMQPTMPPNWATEEKKFAQRERERGRDLERQQRENETFARHCQDLAAQAERQTAWLQSQSRVVRTDAEIRIKQLAEEAKRDGCV